MIGLCHFNQAVGTYLSAFDKFCLLFLEDKRRRIPVLATGQHTTLRLDTGWENKTMCSAWQGTHPENEWIRISFQTVMCYAWWFHQHATLTSKTILILQIFGVVLFSVFSVVNGFTEIEKTPKWKKKYIKWSQQHPWTPKF